jgi:hypothetical protein
MRKCFIMEPLLRSGQTVPLDDLLDCCRCRLRRRRATVYSRLASVPAPQRALGLEPAAQGRPGSSHHVLHPRAPACSVLLVMSAGPAGLSPRTTDSPRSGMALSRAFVVPRCALATPHPRRTLRPNAVRVCIARRHLCTSRALSGRFVSPTFLPLSALISPPFQDAACDTVCCAGQELPSHAIAAPQGPNLPGSTLPCPALARRSTGAAKPPTVRSCHTGVPDHRADGRALAKTSFAQRLLRPPADVDRPLSPRVEAVCIAANSSSVFPQHATHLTGAASCLPRTTLRVMPRLPDELTRSTRLPNATRLAPQRNASWRPATYINYTTSAHGTLVDQGCK